MAVTQGLRLYPSPRTPFIRIYFTLFIRYSMVISRSRMGDGKSPCPANNARAELWIFLRRRLLVYNSGMSLREYIQRLDDEKRLVKVAAPISRSYEIAGVLKQLEPAPVLFEQVRRVGFSGHREPVLLEGGVCRLFRHPGGRDHPVAGAGHRAALAAAGGRECALPGGGGG